jgi:hypothetical protein
MLVGVFAYTQAAPVHLRTTDLVVLPYREASSFGSALLSLLLGQPDQSARPAAVTYRPFVHPRK